MWANALWMCFSGVALVGGGAMLALVIFRTLPIMRKMLAIAERSEASSLRVEQVLLEAKIEFTRIREILEEKTVPLKPKARIRPNEVAKEEEVHAQSGVPTGT